MRIALIVLTAAAAAVAQDSTTVAEERPSYRFSFEQGWRLGVALGTPDTVVTGAELTAGLGEPQFRDVRVVTLDTTPGTITDLTRPFDPLMRPEPIKGDGRLIKEKDGHRLVFDRVEYWDLSQRWWVTFTNGAVEVRNLVKDRWKGTPDEWTAKLDEIEKVVLAHYVKCGAPTGKKAAAPTIGFKQEEDPGKRLFVMAAVEEQLAGILLIRLHRNVVEKGWAGEVAKRYPDKVIAMARQIADRLVMQSKGELTGSKRARAVKGAAWEFGNASVPTFPWAFEKNWMKARDGRIRAAREKLAESIEQSKTAPIERSAWAALVEKELEAINGVDGAEPTAMANATARDVLAPRMFWPGKATFDGDERVTTSKEGAVRTSRAEILGKVKGQIAAFYDVTANQWRVGELTYETWFRSSMDRN